MLAVALEVACPWDELVALVEVLVLEEEFPLEELVGLTEVALTTGAEKEPTLAIVEKLRG